MRRSLAIILSLTLLSVTTSCTSMAPEITETPVLEISDTEITSIMQSCVQQNGERVNAGENFDSGYMDTTMAILSDCVESKSSQLSCGKNDQGITVCGIRGRHTGFSFW